MKMARIPYVDQEECTGCETCVERCQVNAIEVEDDIAIINSDACIGCALCVSTCPTEAISMTRKALGETTHIYEDNAELLQTLAKEKGKEFPFV